MFHIAQRKSQVLTSCKTDGEVAAGLSLLFSFDSVATPPLIKELQCVSIEKYHSKHGKEKQARKASIGRTGGKQQPLQQRHVILNKY
jgi:hypothetical protein